MPKERPQLKDGVTIDLDVLPNGLDLAKRIHKSNPDLPIRLTANKFTGDIIYEASLSGVTNVAVTNPAE